MPRPCTIAWMLLCCLALSGISAFAAETGQTAKPADTGVLTERVIALEKENLVLREDLGKARLDVRTSVNTLQQQQAADMAKMQEKIDALNTQLAAEQEKQTKRTQMLWIAIGLIAIGAIAAN
jgi:hypothetical protein